MQSRTSETIVNKYYKIIEFKNEKQKQLFRVKSNNFTFRSNATDKKSKLNHNKEYFS